MELAGHYQTYIILPLNYCGTLGGVTTKVQTECPSRHSSLPRDLAHPQDVQTKNGVHQAS